MERRNFIRSGLTLGLGATTFGSVFANNFLTESAVSTPFFKLSLAQWSLHRAIREKKLNPYDFVAKAKELGFEGVEYVNQLYKDVSDAKNKPTALKQFASKLNAQAQQHSVQNVLIMIDGEGGYD